MKPCLKNQLVDDFTDIHYKCMDISIFLNSDESMGLSSSQRAELIKYREKLFELQILASNVMDFFDLGVDSMSRLSRLSC